MKIEETRKTFGTVAVLASALLFGSYGVWSKLIGDGMGNFFQGWTRALLIIVILLPVVLWRRELVRIDRKDRKWLAVFLAFTSMTQAPIFYAFNHMDIGTASLLFFVSMFLTMGSIGVVLYGEKLTPAKVCAAILAVVGMYFVFSFTLAAFSALAALMAVVNGIASGGEIAFSKKLSSSYTSLYLILMSWAIILVTNLVISLAIGEAQVVPALSATWLWQICYSVVSLFAFWLVIVGFKHVDATIGALLGLLEIVFSILLGILLFGERITPTIVLGGALILLAMALPHLRDLRFRKQSLSL